jgi:hypothetical protein
VEPEFISDTVNIKLWNKPGHSEEVPHHARTRIHFGYRVRVLSICN